jgi:PAS domain S-box-containing protein
MTALRDISERKQAETLTNMQKHVLEMIAGGKPLAETLNALLQMVQAQSQEMLCSILLLDRDGLHVRHGAAPSLPADYVKAIDGAAIGPCAGSCGTAVFRREPVFVADIESDPLWADYKHLALPHGLRACWSTPIFDAQRNVLGTFAIYFRKPGLPDERHLRLIDVATHTAAVCIAKQRADDALRNTEESLRATIQNTPNVAVQWYDRNGKVMFWNRASELLYGWTAAEAAGKSLDQLIFDRPEAEAFQQALREIERTGKPVGPVEFPLHHRSGRTGVVLSTVFRIQLASGEARFVCMDVDLTDRKRAEAERAELAIRERQAREDFTRRLIVRQEAERSRIAGELHDSLGQNLLLIKNGAHIVLSRADTPPDTRHQLENISEMASEAIAEVRQISHDLHPHQLDLLGLTRAIEAMIDSAAQASGVAFERKLDAVDDVFPTDAATHLYRVVQECLTNALKHAQARSVRVELERDVRHVSLWVKDDGRGFKQEAPVDGMSRGLGLKNIAERVRILNGELRINTTPEAGTTIEVLIPIPGDK